MADKNEGVSAIIFVLNFLADTFLLSAILHVDQMTKIEVANFRQMADKSHLYKMADIFVKQ